MGNLTAGSWKPHTTLNHTSQVARKPLLPSLPLSSHQCQPHLVPEWITGGCMTIAKSLKLDFSCHICTRHYHLTVVRKTPCEWRSLIQGLPHTMYSAYCFNTPHVQAEKAMAPHSSTLAWKIPWTEDPGGLQSMGSLRVGHDWATSLSLFTFMHWRRKWQPTPVFLPGESQGRQSLVGCRL